MIRQVTLTISHEKTREITREEVDRAIDVIERHLEKEARTRNLLDEQATADWRALAGSGLRAR